MLKGTWGLFTRKVKLKLYPRGLWEGIVSAAPVQANYLIRILYRLTKLFARRPEMTRPLPAKLKGGMRHANSASGSFVRYVVFFRHRRMVILDWTLLSLATQYSGVKCYKQECNSRHVHSNLDSEQLLFFSKRKLCLRLSVSS